MGTRTKHQIELLHPLLNGRHIVFNYAEQDHFAEGSALALLRLRGNELKTIYHPGRSFEPINLHESNAGLLELMKRKGIKEVVSVFNCGKDFFWVPGSWYSLEEEEKQQLDADNPEREDKNEVECWAEWDAVCSGEDGYEFLASNGINILMYDPDKKEFFK